MQSQKKIPVSQVVKTKDQSAQDDGDFNVFLSLEFHRRQAL